MRVRSSALDTEGVLNAVKFVTRPGLDDPNDVRNTTTRLPFTTVLSALVDMRLSPDAVEPFEWNKRRALYDLVMDRRHKLSLVRGVLLKQLLQVRQRIRGNAGAGAGAGAGAHSKSPPSPVAAEDVVVGVPTPMPAAPPVAV